MDRQQIDSLHEQASDHYVRGEYRKALDVWKQVLDLDPQDEKAQEGVRLSSLLEDGEVGEPTHSTESLHRRLEEVEMRLETGDLHGALRSAELLRSEWPDDPEVLSALARAYLAAGDADHAAEATSQLLSLNPEYAEAAKLLEECRHVAPPESELGVVVLREGGASESASPAAQLPVEPSEASFPGFESHSFRPTGAVAVEEKGLAVASLPAEEKRLDPVAHAPADPAANVLKQRVQDLLGQARAAAGQGRKDDAFGLLSRLLILDEQNKEALALEEQLRHEAGEATRNIDDRLNEGIQCLEQGQIEEARQLFLQVLEISPDHREALDYLEKADARLAARVRQQSKKEDGRSGEPAPPVRGHVWQPRAAEAEAAPVETSRPTDPLVPGDHPVAAAPEAEVEARKEALTRTPSRRVLLLALSGLGGALVLAGVFLTRSHWGQPAHPAVSAAQGAATGKSAASSSKPKPQAPATAQTATAAASLTPEERVRNVAETMNRAGAAFDARNYDAAVVAYNEVLVLDPANEEARKKLLEAGDLYRKDKTEIDKLERAQKTFAAGEYESALRLFYRLPDGLVDPAVLNRYRVNGWYNLGVVALRAADCNQAMNQFAEALAIDATDAGVRKARELAEKCQGQRKDRSYYNTVENLPFRNLED